MINITRYYQRKWASQSEIKDAQFETAKTLMNVYSSENNALKQENEILSAAVEANFQIKIMSYNHI